MCGSEVDGFEVFCLSLSISHGLNHLLRLVIGKPYYGHLRNYALISSVA